MLSKSRIKLITSLKLKKYREQHGLFVVEGLKTISEFLNSNFELEALYTVNPFEGVSGDKQFVVAEPALQKVSFLQRTNSALAVFKFKPQQPVKESGLVVALDNVRDPGNLGTIIRLCDWFGVNELVCSSGTVDCFNPKVVQATMGSLTRVNITYCDLNTFIAERAESQNIYGTFMDGVSVYDAETSLGEGVVVMGNEANGITPEIEALVSHKITIPRFGNLQQTESLNVATAAAITLSEFKRRTIEK